MKVSGFSIPEKVVVGTGTNRQRGRRVWAVAWAGDEAGVAEIWATVVVNCSIRAIKADNWQELAELAELARGEAAVAEESASGGAELEWEGGGRVGK